MSEPNPKGDPGIQLGANAKVLRIIEAALARGAENPLAFHIGELTSFADVFVLLTGRSERTVRAIAEGILEELRATQDFPLGVEGLAEGQWDLIDCNDVIVHVFEPEVRERYSLDRLWSDAPRTDLVALGVPEAALAAAGSPPDGGPRTELG